MGKLTKQLRSLMTKRQSTVKRKSFERAIFPSSGSYTDRFMRIWGGIKTENLGRQVFEKVSPKEIDGLPIPEAIVKLVKSDPTMDLAVSVFSTLTSQDHHMSAESDRAQREIDSILQMLEEKKNPFSLFVSHMATSIVIRGNVLVESIFLEGEVDNLYALDPLWVEWREVTEEGSARWAMGQYREGDWKEIESPNWYWESIGAIVGERTGRSPLQTAIPSIIDNSSMRNSLHSILDRMAFTKRMIKIKALEMARLAADDSEFNEEDINTLTDEAEKFIEEWKTLGVNDIPYFSDIMEWETDPGAGSGLDFTDKIDRMDDRKSLRGTKTPPSIAGSNEFTAESSAKNQTMFYSALLSGGQEAMKRSAEFCFRRFLRSRGIIDDPIFTSKSVDVVARVEEAKAFNEIMKGIRVATSSGINVEHAIELYEESSGNKFTPTIKEKISNVLNEGNNELTGQNEPTGQNDPTGDQ